jgi:alpha/beta superfamily hydrolase
MNDHVVYFAHGKESGPWGTKIAALAEVAKAKGFHVESPDYSVTMDPEVRVQQLLDLKPAAKKRLVLFGSSMGSYVSAVASQQIKPDGLFLLAPAFYREGYEYQNPAPSARITMIVHGWNDELIPADDIVRYAKEHQSRLLLVDSDHRLMSALPLIETIFADFLDEIIKV